MRIGNRPVSKTRSNKKLGITLSIAAVGMFGFGYALVPVYNMMCKTFGINGKPLNTAVAIDNSVDNSRTITVQFLSTKNNYLPWKFHPLVRSVKVHPGENKTVAFYAENETNEDMVVQAIPSVTPPLAAKFLKKTECFCFSKQDAKGRQAMQWPLLFHLDKELPKKIKTVTLSYTLFDITKVAKNIKENKNAGHIPSE
jgi:cytochrome c oxidase assembly protein subunit 11